MIHKTCQDNIGSTNTNICSLQLHRIHDLFLYVKNIIDQVSKVNSIKKSYA